MEKEDERKVDDLNVRDPNPRLTLIGYSHCAYFQAFSSS